MVTRSTSNQVVWYVTATPGRSVVAILKLTFNFNYISDNHILNIAPVLIHNLGYFRVITTLQTINFKTASGRQFTSVRCLSHSALNQQSVTFS